MTEAARAFVNQHDLSATLDTVLAEARQRFHVVSSHVEVEGREDYGDPYLDVVLKVTDEPHEASAAYWDYLRALVDRLPNDKFQLISVRYLIVECA